MQCLNAGLVFRRKKKVGKTQVRLYGMIKYLGEDFSCAMSSGLRVLVLQTLHGRSKQSCWS